MTSEASDEPVHPSSLIISYVCLSEAFATGKTEYMSILYVIASNCVCIF